MADYYTELVVSPLIPKKYMTDELQNMLEALYFDIEPDEEYLYLYASEYSAHGYGEDAFGNEIEYTEEELVKAFQELIK